MRTLVYVLIKPKTNPRSMMLRMSKIKKLKLAFKDCASLGSLL